MITGPIIVLNVIAIMVLSFLAWGDWGKRP